MSICLRTKWLWVQVPLQSLKFQISRLFRERSSFTCMQLHSVDLIETRMWHDKSTQLNHHKGTYSHHSSIIWPVWIKGWVYVYQLSGCVFESFCSQILFCCIKMPLSQPSMITYLNEKSVFLYDVTTTKFLRKIPLF